MRRNHFLNERLQPGCDGGRPEWCAGVEVTQGQPELTLMSISQELAIPGCAATGRKFFKKGFSHSLSMFYRDKTRKSGGSRRQRCRELTATLSVRCVRFDLFATTTAMEPIAEADVPDLPFSQ